jgi:uncharacterized protein YndB with AHSA1/START domain
VIAAPCARVFRAFVTPAAVARWLPPDGMTADVHAWDARPGGAVHVTLRYDERPPGSPGKTTDRTDVVRGRFVEAVEDERVVLEVDFEADDPAFAGTMTMTWSLHATAGGTRASLVAENVPPGIAPEAHETGLRSTLEHLAAYVEPGIGDW